MIKLPHIAGFEGLLDLDRRGVDIRPTLLRVLTDQYLQSRTHTLDEERQYTELALRLIGETDIATRAAVAMRLAPHACAPRAILLQLARDELEVAEPILLHSPRLTPADLAAIASERGPCYATVIARCENAATAPTSRGPIPLAAPERHAAPLPAAAPAPPPPPPPLPPELPAEDLPPPRDGSAGGVASIPVLATPAAGPKPEAIELCELFFAAGPAERRMILIGLDYLPGSPPRSPATMQRTDVWKLESAALQHNADVVVRTLEHAVGISRAQARRIVNDETGEPIVVAAKALHLPADVLQRMLLFMNPRVGQSVDRVYELAALYADISVAAACRLIAIWRNADPPDAPSAKHQALWQDAVEDARRALLEIRAPARREQPAPRPAERAAGNDGR